MKVTVCQLPNEPSELGAAWEALCGHVREQRSDLVLLPEMPFFRWLPHDRAVRESDWLASVAAHEGWIRRLDELGPATVAGTRPVVDNGARHNMAWLKVPDSEAIPVHAKYYLPDEPGFWEASWYQRGDGVFRAVETSFGRAGFLVCTELWFGQRAREYAAQDVRFLLCPRGTPASSTDKWIAGGRAAAVVSGAFCLSSNLAGETSAGGHYAGRGWVIEPEEGDVLALTSDEAPFATMQIDPAAADAAKETYPRYVRD